MKKILTKIGWRNWNKAANATLTGLAGIFGIIAVYRDEIISVMHLAPFEISHKVDEYIIWILKVVALILTMVTLGTRKKNDLNIGIKLTEVPAEDDTKN